MKKGSFTVEASLIFPFILAVIVLVIYAAFFIHDRAVMSAAACKAAIRGSEITDPHGDIYDKARKTGEEEMKGRLLSTKIRTIDVNVDSREVRVSVCGDFIIPGGVIPVPGIEGRGTVIKVNALSSRLDPAEFIRSCRVIEEHVGRD